jgi:hypothetical protein
MENRKSSMPSPEEIQKKLQIIDDLFKMAYQVKVSQLKKKYPELSQKEINHKAYAMIEKGCR